MPDAIIDACCLIDLLAAGYLDAILLANNYAWHMPSAVQAEVRFCRQHDPALPGKTVPVPVDLSDLISSGVLAACSPENQKELDRFVDYAAVFRSDGEAMCLALAEQRSWAIATDDRKAIRVAQQMGLTVVSCPQLVKAWAHATKPNQAVLARVLQDIQILAKFKPNQTMPEYRWWIKELAKGTP